MLPAGSDTLTCASTQPKRPRRLALATIGVGMACAATSSATDLVLGLPRRPRFAPSFNALLYERRSVRNFADRSLALALLSDLLWAAQGISGPGSRRTAPSAGALYPLELHVVAERVEKLPSSVWRYAPTTHSLQQTIARSVIDLLLRASGNQQALALAPAVLAITAVQARSEAKYGTRAGRYVVFEAGAAAQNFALQAAALGLGSVVIGAFDDDAAALALQLPKAERVLALMPVGTPR